MDAPLLPTFRLFVMHTRPLTSQKEQDDLRKMFDDQATVTHFKTERGVWKNSLVTFATTTHATKARNALQRAQFRGIPLRIEFARPTTRVLVRGLPRDAPISSVRNAFPTAATVELDNTWRGGDDFALVFERLRDAEAVVARGATIDGRELSFDYGSVLRRQPDKRQRGKQHQRHQSVPRDGRRTNSNARAQSPNRWKRSRSRSSSLMRSRSPSPSLAKRRSPSIVAQQASPKRQKEDVVLQGDPILRAISSQLLTLWDDIAWSDALKLALQNEMHELEERMRAQIKVIASVEQDVVPESTSKSEVAEQSQVGYEEEESVLEAPRVWAVATVLEAEMMDPSFPDYIDTIHPVEVVEIQDGTAFRCRMLAFGPQDIDTWTVDSLHLPRLEEESKRKSWNIGDHVHVRIRNRKSRNKMLVHIRSHFELR
jgi:hypothetical protein